MPVWQSGIAAQQSWIAASVSYAQVASGTVNAYVGNNLRSGAVWTNYELPTLLRNPNVTQIIVHNVQTNTVTTIPGIGSP